MDLGNQPFESHFLATVRQSPFLLRSLIIGLAAGTNLPDPAKDNNHRPSDDDHFPASAPPTHLFPFFPLCFDHFLPYSSIYLIYLLPYCLKPHALRRALQLYSRPSSPTVGYQRLVRQWRANCILSLPTTLPTSLAGKLGGTH